MEQEVRQVVVCNKNVHQAVIIIIRKSDAHASTDVLANAGLNGDVLESPIAPVPVQRVGQSLEVFGMAVNAQVAIAIATKAIEVRRPMSIIDYERSEERRV